MRAKMRVRSRWSLVGALACVVFLACGEAPLTGRNQLLLLPESAEIEMGVQAYQEVLAMESISREPQASAQLQRVGARVAAVTMKDDYRWEFAVINEPQTVNAFCLPGGKIAAYTGILPIAQDDTGLAVVLGHEIGHAVARHGGERISQQLILGLGLEAVQLALRRRDPKVVRLLLAALGVGAKVGIILPFSRAQESEADRIGLIYMAKAGYDPRAAPSFWMRMAASSGDRTRPPEFLSTHPSPESRVSDIQQWLPEALQHYAPRPAP